MSATKVQLTPFHLAFPVNDLAATRSFYVDVLGCREGRNSDHWIDFDFFGHQVVAHRIPDSVQQTAADARSNHVDGHDVPVPHFGVVLAWDTFHKFAERLVEKDVSFEIAPYVRFEGLPGEQSTMFFRDPSGNALEFKAFRNMENLFAT